jgi:hypothetical protein
MTMMFYLIDAEAKIVERKGSSKGKRGFQFIVCFEKDFFPIGKKSWVTNNE